MIGYVFGLLRVFADSVLMSSRKKLRHEHYSASKLLWMQSILSLVVGLIFYFMFQPKLVFPAIAFSSLTVFLVSVGNLLNFYACKFDDYSKLYPLMGTGIVYTLVLGILVLGEVPGLLQTTGIVGVFVGIFFLGNGRMTFRLDFLLERPVWITLLSTFMGATSLIAMKKSLQYAPLFDIVIFNLILSLPIVYVMYLVVRPSVEHKDKPVFTRKVLIWFVFMMVAEPATLILNVVTVSFLHVVYANVIFSTSIVFSLFVGKFLFQERVVCRVLPTIIIFIGVLGIILG